MTEIAAFNEPYNRRENDVVVVYTIKEMFTQTTQSIARIETLMGQFAEGLSRKANVTDLELIDARVTHFEKQEATNQDLIEDYKSTRALVRSHETTLQRQDAVRASTKASWALVFGVIATLGSMVAILGRALNF